MPLTLYLIIARSVFNSKPNSAFLISTYTAFYISHRLSSCIFCDRIAVFSEWKIAEYGSHDELIRIPSGIYAEMFEAQAKYYRDAS